MNKYFSKVTSLLLAGVMVFAVGCTDVEKDINNIQETIGAMDPNAPSLVAQLKALQDADAALKAALEAAEANAKALYATKEELATAKGELNTAISALQTKDNELAEALSKAVKDAADAVAALDGKHNKDVETLRGEIAAALKTAKDLLDAQSKEIDELTGAFNAVKSDYDGFKTSTLATLEDIKKNLADKAAELNGLIDANASAIEVNATAIAENAEKISALGTKMGVQLADLKSALEAKDAELAAAIAENTKSIETLTTVTIPEIEDRLNETDRLITSLQKADANLEAALAEYKLATDANIAAINAAIAEISKVVAAHGVKIDENAENIDELFANLAATNKNLETLTNKFNTLKKDVEDYVAFHALMMQAQLEALTEDYETQIAELREELVEMIKSGDAANKALIDENKAAIAELNTNLEDAVEEYTKLVASLQGQINTLGQIDQNLEDAIKENAAAIEKAVEEYTKLVASLQGQINTLGQIDQNLEDSIKENAAAIEKAVEEYTKLVASLQGKIDELGRIDEDLEDAIKENLAKINENLTEIETNAKAISALQTLTTVQGSKITALEGRVETLETGLANVKAMAEQNKAAIAELNTKLETAIESIDANKTSIDDLAKKGAAFEAKITDELTALKNKHAADISANFMRILELQIDFDNLKTDLQNLQQKVDGNYNALNDKIDEIKGELDKDIEDIIGRIQSIVYVPTHVDGQITMNYAELAGDYMGAPSEVTYKVVPAEYAQKLADNVGVLSYSVSGKLQTRADEETAPKFEILKATATNGNLTLTVLPVAESAFFTASRNDYAISLNASHGISNYATVYNNIYVNNKEIQAIVPVVAETVSGKLVEIAAGTKKYEFQYVELTEQVIVPGHEVAYKLTVGNDAKIYSEKEMKDMGYNVDNSKLIRTFSISPDDSKSVGVLGNDRVNPNIEGVEDYINKTYPSENTEFPEFNTLFNRAALNDEYELTSNYATYNLTKEDPKAVGYVETVKYEYVYPGKTPAKASVEATATVTKITRTLTFDQITCNWDYTTHAEADAQYLANVAAKDFTQPARYFFRDNKLGAPAGVDNLPEDVTVESLLNKSTAATIKFYSDEKLTTEVGNNNEFQAAINYNVDEKSASMTVFFDRTEKNKIWGTTYVVFTYELPNIVVKVVAPIKTVNRPDVIDIKYNPWILTVNRDFEFGHDKLPGNTLDKISTDMAGFVNAKEWTKAAYINDVLGAAHAENTAHVRTITNVDTKKYIHYGADDMSSMQYDLEKLVSTIGYTYRTPNLVELGMNLEYKDVITTWFGQKITIIQPLKLSTPNYKFVARDMRVMTDADGYYTLANGKYSPEVRSHAVKAFNIAELDLDDAFDIINPLGYPYEKPEESGLVTTYVFDESETSLDDGIKFNGNNELVYNGTNKSVKVNGRLELVNTNGTSYDVTDAFAKYEGNFRVCQFDPVGELVILNGGVIEQEIIDAKKYEVNILQLLQLQENRHLLNPEEAAEYNHHLIVGEGNDAHWVVGDDENGFANNKRVANWYKPDGSLGEGIFGLTIDYSKVTIPLKYTKNISFEPTRFGEGIFTFDNTSQLYLTEDVTIPVTIYVKSTWGVKEATVSVKFLKNVK